MCAKLITHDSADDTPTRSITTAVVLVAESKILGKSRTLIFLYANPRIRQYTTAIAADSVGVNHPSKIPPMTRNTMNIEGIALHKIIIA